MTQNRSIPTACFGCGVLILLLVVAIPIAWLAYTQSGLPLPGTDATQPPAAVSDQAVVPTLTLPPQPTAAAQATLPQPRSEVVGGDPDFLTGLYQQVNPGVVNVQVFVERAGGFGEGAGSGFILDSNGYIVTNNHVVAGAEIVTVVFYNGSEAQAEVVGTDDDSDLAVIRVDRLPEGAHPVPLGDSSAVQVGEWVVAIGNPFGLGSSMSLGIVSATGRIIPSGATPFSIPEAIQTDAAINPGNSGGPLLNLEGEVVGVNAQIATGGAAAGAGVGFAIPSNVVRRVAPVLIERGAFDWPWLGVEGASINLALMTANGLETQQGAYIHDVFPNSPAEAAGLQGTSGVEVISGVEVPVGGDVVVAADGQPVTDFSDLLADIARRQPGDSIRLTILRDGQQQEVTVNLAPRPDDVGL